MVDINDAKTIFNNVLSLGTWLWVYCRYNWGIFGTWLISFAILRKIAKTFNKLKS